MNNESDYEYDVLIKTRLGLEKIVENRIKEIDPNAKTWSKPYGFKGLVLVKHGSIDRDKLIENIRNKIVEADKIIPIELIVEAEPNTICREIKELCINKIESEESFAVRTTRRGSHSFTSIDVNVIVGDCIRRYTNASVNLRYPDKIVLIEIIQNKAYISILPGDFEYHKYSPEKKALYRLFNKIAVIQTPYLGPINAVVEMGKRIGREIQNFEVKEFIVAPMSIVDGYSLAKFILSVIEGRDSRYRVQEKSYARKPWKTPVYVMDLYQLVRDRGDEVIIVFEPEGKYVVDVADELSKLILGSRKRVNLLFGSREGIPPGIYRYADLVVDLAPGITLSTDYAVAAGLIAVSTVIYNKYRLMNNEGIDTSGR